MPSLTHAQSKAQVDDLYAQTQELVGATGWDKPGGEWQGCGLPDGTEGDTWFMFHQRFAPLQADPMTVAKQVQTLWAKLGYKATIAKDPNLTPPQWVLSDPPYLTGTSPDGLLIQSAVSVGYADFEATSRCVKGDLGH